MSSVNDQNGEFEYLRVPSAWKLLLTITITIFVVELVIMLYLHQLFEQSILFSVIDAVILTVVISPIIYYWFYKPFVLEINQRQRAETELKQAYVNIEALVEERTVELERVNERLRREIDERRSIEGNLRESERSLSEAQRVAQLGSWSFDIQDNIARWSDETCRIFGVPVGCQINHEQFLEFVHPDDRERVEQTWTAALQEGLFVCEYRIVADGEVKWVADKSEIEVDKDGRPLSGIGTVQDITTRKQTDEDLRESERSLSEAQRIAHIGSWSFDVEKGTFSGSDETYHIYGLPVVTPLAYEAALEFVHPDDRAYFDQAFTTILRGGSLELEYRILVEGEVKWVWAKGETKLDEAGRPLKVFGTANDITERKRDETEREQLLHNLGERMKELRCLYEIAETEQLPDILIEDAFSKIVELIPPSWQYPDITCARISIDGREFKTPDFKATDWCQSAKIIVEGDVLGAVDVCYLMERPEIDEGPFLKEERDLIEAIAERSGRIIERKRAAERRQEFEEALHQKDLDIRKAYADVFSAVTGEKLLLLTHEEISAAQGEPTTRPYRVSSFEDLAGSRDFLRSALETRGLAKDDLNSLILASGEAITNGVKHADSCEVQVYSLEETVQLRISDHGSGIDFGDLPKATLLSGFSTEPSLGMGFALVLDICDRVLLSTGPEGTTLLLETGGKEEEGTIDDILARGLFKEGAA